MASKCSRRSTVLALVALTFGMSVAPTAGDGPCPGSGNCCLANPTPGCEDADCCDFVCEIDPFCCSNQWDISCANAAIQLCPASACDTSGDCPGEGDCCVANLTPGCSDTQCCEQICAADPYCCNTEWDDVCSDAANANCAACVGGDCGAPTAGSCCEANGSPACDESDCCVIVCSQEPSCCDEEWTQACADMAIGVCLQCDCGVPGSGDCCEENGSAGCEDFDCCNIVCDLDSFCCDVLWDDKCVAAAEQNCASCASSCGQPGTGSCCAANGTPSCDDAACCAAVCDIVPPCCDIAWNVSCVTTAALVCGDFCACSSPGDFDGDLHVDLDDYNAFQACYTGANNPPHAPGCSCLDFDADDDVDLIDWGALQRAFTGP